MQAARGRCIQQQISSAIRVAESGCAHTHGQLSRHDEKLYPGVEIFNKRPSKTHVARSGSNGMGWDGVLVKFKLYV